jgi:endonuclease-8
VPEGDTIRRLAAKVEDRFAGSVVARSTFRHPRLATVDLAGQTLLGTASTGKHLLLRFDGGSTLTVHLLMQGRVVFGRVTAEPHRRRFELRFGDPKPGSMTGLDIPKLDLVRTRDEDAVVGHLGPDACGSYDHGAAVDRLRSVGALPLGGALLDQRVVAGLGNIYAVETPFIVGIDPRTPVGELDRPDAALALGVALIRANARLGPQNTTGRRLHTDDHWVIDGRTKRCPLCGERLLRLDEAATPWRRRTAICPSCQAPGNRHVDLERARRLVAGHPARHALDLDAGALVADTTEKVEPMRRGVRPGPPADRGRPGR